MNLTTFKAGIKAGVLVLVHEAEEKFLGEKQGPAKKAWVISVLKDRLKEAGIYGKRIFGIFSFDALIDSLLSGLIEWAAAKLKAGVDVLEKL